MIPNQMHAGIQKHKNACTYTLVRRYNDTAVMVNAHLRFEHIQINETVSPHGQASILYYPILSVRGRVYDKVNVITYLLQLASSCS